MARRTDIDWDAIEREYRLGQKSNKQLAADFGVSGSQIGRRAKEKEWVQDKAEEVRTRTTSILVKATAAEASGNANANANPNATPTDKEIKVAATVAASVVLGHRRGLVKLTKLRDAMLDEIDLQTTNLGAIAQLIEPPQDAEDNGADRRQELLQRLNSLPSRIESLKKLAEIDEKIRKGEREAFGIEKGFDDRAGDLPSKLTDAERASRLAAIFAAAQKRAQPDAA